MPTRACKHTRTSTHATHGANLSRSQPKLRWSCLRRRRGTVGGQIGGNRDVCKLLGCTLAAAQYRRVCRQGAATAARARPGRHMTGKSPPAPTKMVNTGLQPRGVRVGDPCVSCGHVRRRGTHVFDDALGPGKDGADHRKLFACRVKGPTPSMRESPGPPPCRTPHAACTRAHPCRHRCLSCQLLSFTPIHGSRAQNRNTTKYKKKTKKKHPTSSCLAHAPTAPLHSVVPLFRTRARVPCAPQTLRPHPCSRCPHHFPERLHLDLIGAKDFPGFALFRHLRHRRLHAGHEQAEGPPHGHACEPPRRA